MGINTDAVPNPGTVIRNYVVSVCAANQPNGLRWAPVGYCALGPGGLELNFTELLTRPRGQAQIRLRLWSVAGGSPFYGGAGTQPRELPIALIDAVLAEFGYPAREEGQGPVHDIMISEDVVGAEPPLLARFNRVLQEVGVAHLSATLATPAAAAWEGVIAQAKRLSDRQTRITGGPESNELTARVVKLMEEAGELAQGVLGMTGSVNASASAPVEADEVAEEAVDVIINGLDLAFRLGLSPEALQAALTRKMNKWGSKLTRAG